MFFLLFPATYSPWAKEKAGDSDNKFVNILKTVYQISCGDTELLRDYYLPEADIIHDGRQVSLDDTIDELRRMKDSAGDLNCAYKPRVRKHRVDHETAYLFVRESIKISSHSMGEQRFEQLCTYIFHYEDFRWKIALDHCSTVPGSVA